MRGGYTVVHDFDGTAGVLAAVQRHLAERDVQAVYRPHGDRPLRYNVIDGHQIAGHLPEVVDIAGRVQAVAETFAGHDLVPLPDTAIALNINITPAGGSYRWHYDRNPVTAVLYLNEVDGGQLEFYPRHRLVVGNGRGRLQRALDRLWSAKLVLGLIGRKVSVQPTAGCLVVMQGDRCLHSVAPVHGSQERICVVMSFTEPDAAATDNAALDTYLYTPRPTASGDPNYRS